MKELIKFLEKEGYCFIEEKTGKGLCGLMKMLLTTGLFINLDKYGYEGRYCYQNEIEAIVAIKTWDGVGDPPGNWIKYKGEEGERYKN